MNFVQEDVLFKGRVNFVLEPSLDCMEVSIDADMLKGSFLNLFINAAQAMPNGGEITVKLTRDENHVWICVQDTGEGIPSENLEHIFSPFFTTKHEGNGFGLSEVHKVVQAHGGSIDVSSIEGQGSAFTITLPITIKQLEGVAYGY
jgi:signal transduction histidine kinase